MAVLRHSEMFPKIAQTIDELWVSLQSWARRDQIIEHLLRNPAVLALLAAEDVTDAETRRWRVGNAVDWFSQKYTSGDLGEKARFDRKKVDGKWAYIPAGMGTQAAETPTTQPPEPTPTYTLGRHLGGGGMADVYLGTRHIPGEPDREVAVKVYRDAFDQEELDLLRLLDHPNIIKLLDTCPIVLLGRADRGLVLELADGGTLQERIARSAGLPLLEALGIMKSVCAGLHYLHNFTPRQIIHRDLKPLNILYCGGVVKLSDVGISKLVSTTTVLHSMAQTHAYAAPEMYGTTTSPPVVSHKADIYALGITLYQVLTASFPYRASTFHEWAWYHQNGRIPDDPRVVGWAKAFVEGCTVKDYRQRWDISRAIACLDGVSGA